MADPDKHISNPLRQLITFLKMWLYVGALLCGVMLLGETVGTGETIPKENANKPNIEETGTITEKIDRPDNVRLMETLSNELRSRKSVLPRQNFQWSNNTIDTRTIRSQTKMQQLFRLKSEDRLRKVSVAVSDCQITNYFTLLCRRGYYIYALRKLII
ncbi:MAG: hypothetical protein LBT42_06205 [Tannerella sp.]|jgi:hypothetical protein|nr:hypothetical protein [Tannerella sp.]